MRTSKSFVFVDMAGQSLSDPNCIPVHACDLYRPGEAVFGFALREQPCKEEDERDSWPGEYHFPAVPTFFVEVPSGNYKVQIVLGHPSRPGSTTVKAGQGHLLANEIPSEAGQSISVSSAVHVEDGRFKLAFMGAAPAVQSVSMERAADAPTIFLAGDSTVTDQASGQYPYAGWGQMLSLFLNASVSVSNRARSGRSSKSFITEGRLDWIWNHIKPGDFLFVQFAHNDEKDNAGGTKPFTTYQQYLKQYLDGAKARGAAPVLISPMHRRFWESDGRIQNTHGEYIEAMRLLAEAEQVAFIDLAAESKRLFEQLGEEETKRIFMWTAPGEYPNFPEGTADNTHFKATGAIEIAGLVAGAFEGVPLLAALLKRP
ncbi:rhamnogalacturonan acetylesterase [Paenibacillus sp. y28]|uniref:rhamnogalacturonan acetylesterase n=1 Tax=Paenibacillus sp. y28 TaxID=3129110 RepID=UPI0030162136